MEVAMGSYTLGRYGGDHRLLPGIFSAPGTDQLRSEPPLACLNTTQDITIPNEKATA